VVAFWCDVISFDNTIIWQCEVSGKLSIYNDEVQDINIVVFLDDEVDLVSV
jgi:hypothetical protein